MYTVLIVDDEERSRKGLRKSIDWGNLGIEVIGECSNGLEARDQIINLQPDVVICDVMMPHLDGLSLVSDVKDLFPAIQYIFLSGYSQTKYLRKAMTLSAIDYIIKPFSSDEMNDALIRAIAQSAKHKQHDLVQVNDCALELIHIKDASHIDTVHLPIKLNEPLLTFIIAIADKSDSPYSLTSDHSILLYKLKNDIQPALSNLLSELFSGHFLMAHLNNSFVIHANTKPEHKHSMQLHYDLNRIFSLFESEEDQVCIGISSIYTGQHNMLAAYREARDARKLAFLRNYGHILTIPIQEQKAFKLQEDFPEKLIKKLDSKDSAEAFRMLDKYLLEMSHARINDISLIRQELISIASELSKSLSNLGSDMIHFSETIYYARDLAQIRVFLIDLMNQYNENMSNMDSIGRSVLDIEKYIRENFNKNISITDIAEKVFVTPNYLSYLYKSRTGKTINQYIQDLRMEEARRLLSESHLKIGSIARQLGFANQTYFTRLFTKTHRETPSQYRSKHAHSAFHDEVDDD